jgi:hypothetical protein
MLNNHDFSELKGEVLSQITIPNTDNYKNEGYPTTVIFTTNEGKHFFLCHHQECCEHVHLEEIHGCLEDLLNTEILHASKEEVTIVNDKTYGLEKATFYLISTIKGYVTLRFIGESNGYYSVGVDFFTFNDECRRKKYGYKWEGEE